MDLITFPKYGYDRSTKGRCCKCLCIKDHDMFYKNKSKRGITSRCKICTIVYSKERHTKNNNSKTCECGGKYIEKNKRTHYKTKKHIRYQEKQPNENLPEVKDQTI